MAPPKQHTRRLHVSREADGQRLDLFLVGAFPDYSRRRLREIVKQGGVRVNGVPGRPGTTLRAGDELDLPSLKEAAAQVRQTRREKDRRRRGAAAPAEVVELYRDETLLAVSKPANMPVHGGANLGTVTTLLEAIQEDIVGGFGLIHRLDRDTSGVIALVRGEEARRRTMALFGQTDGGIEKVYEALVDDTPHEATGEIDRPLTLPDRRGQVQVDVEYGKPAVSRYAVLESFPQASRLRVELLTGRTHQIRAHLSAIGHPLLVDRRYGRRSAWRLVDPRGRLDAKLRRTPLHAASLALPHPMTGERIEIHAPLPGDMHYALEVLRIDAGRKRKDPSSAPS